MFFILDVEEIGDLEKAYNLYMNIRFFFVDFFDLFIDIFSLEHTNISCLEYNS